MCIFYLYNFNNNKFDLYLQYDNHYSPYYHENIFPGAPLRVRIHRNRCHRRNHGSPRYRCLHNPDGNCYRWRQCYQLVQAEKQKAAARLPSAAGSPPLGCFTIPYSYP